VGFYRYIYIYHPSPGPRDDRSDPEKERKKERKKKTTKRNDCRTVHVEYADADALPLDPKSPSEDLRS
jgi:hypothetical protein